jgi:hypothetical protein
MASAKQIAARKKFARIMKSGGFKKRKTKAVKKTTTRKRKTTTTKRKSIQLKRAAPRKRTMKRRSSIRRVARRGSKGIGSSLKTGVIGDVVKGIGAGSLVSLVMSRVAPGSSITPIASTGAAFLTGGLIGGAANLVLSGGLGQLGGIFGGASTPQQEFGV